MNSLSQVKSDLLWHSLSDRLISNRDICVSRWTVWTTVTEAILLFYIRDERLDILEPFKKPQEALLEVSASSGSPQNADYSNCRLQTADRAD